MPPLCHSVTMTVVVNLAYFLMLLGFITPDILRLRLLLIVAQMLLIIYATANGLWVMPAWNLLFLLINVYMVIGILRERRALRLPPELEPIYAEHFCALTPREFLGLWQSGTRQSMADGELARAGAQPDALYFLLDGQVEVCREGTLVRRLPAGYFVAEMSLLTGQPANADVRAHGPIEVMRWDRTGLAAIRQRNAVLWTKIQSVLGRDLVEKIHLGELHHQGTA